MRKKVIFLVKYTQNLEACKSLLIFLGGDSRYSRQMFKDAASENELEFKTKKGE